MPCHTSAVLMLRVPLWLLPPQTWTGMVTQLIPPNYGIVDGTAFYVNAVVQGRLPQVGAQSTTLCLVLCQPRQSAGVARPPVCRCAVVVGWVVALVL